VPPTRQPPEDFLVGYPIVELGERSELEHVQRFARRATDWNANPLDSRSRPWPTFPRLAPTFVESDFCCARVSERLETVFKYIHTARIHFFTMKFSRFVLLGTASLALAQHHNHVHRHPARHGSPVQGRDTVTVVATDPAVVTVYELNGEFLDWATVEAGLKSGIYVLMGDSISTVIPASSSTPTPTPTPSSSAAIFFQETTSTTPTSTYVPPTSTSAPPPAATTKASTSGSSSGNWPDFVSGKTKCGDFPSAFGPVAADWLNLDGYTGVQTVESSFSLGVSAAISYISTGISGTGCTENSFCSYACPPGYQKSQWPSAQGSTGQSVGGLYCGSDGYLYLSREAYPQLCTPGTGSIFVKNTLGSGDNVPICRTDYPGTESETIALNVEPGTTDALTCPDASTYYIWENAYTSAQYYVNPAGTSWRCLRLG
jgi:hypothetical protein